MNAEREVVVIGNPDNRRVRFFQEALARRGHSPARVLSYRDLLAGRCDVEDVPSGSIVRIDSPGEDFEVERRLLASGEAAAVSEGSPAISADRLAALRFDSGRILFPRQWYLGFCLLLRRWHRTLNEIGGVRFASWPPDIALMFDKAACHRACAAADVPVPEPFGPVSCLDELIARMDAAGVHRVFVKPAHGSSASGAVALERRGDRMAATTTAEMETVGGELRLYNSLGIRRYTKLDEIRPLIDELAPHRVHVERWLPKASLDGRVFDIRVVVIGRRPQHVVVRTSRGPFTNLHLGNRRGNAERLVEKLGPARHDQLCQTCIRTAEVFPRSLQMGIDVLFTPGFRRHALLEVNAFGDLLPGVEFHNKDTYTAQVDALSTSHLAISPIRGGCL